MGRNKTLIPAKIMARILEEAGAHRVSKDSAKLLSEIIEERGEEISKRAIEIAKHAKRKTVNEGDVKLAAKR